MSAEFPAELTAGVVELDTADAPETFDTAVIELPVGASAQGAGIRALEATTKEDESFGELIIDTDAIPAAGETAAIQEIDIPRQFRADQAENAAQADEPVPEARSQKPEIALDIRGYGPFHELLLQEGDAGAALVPYLHRLAVMKDDYCERSAALEADDGDELEKGLVDRLGDENGARGNSEAWQLKDILGNSLQELKARPELMEEGTVNWLGLGTALLDRAGELGRGPSFDVRRSILTSAATAALMSESPDDRITFLEQTAERRLLRPMAAALNHSDVSVILPGSRNKDLRGGHGRDDRSIQRLRSLGQAFDATPDEIARYRQLVERNLGEPVDAQTAMREAIDAPMTADGVLQGDHGEVLEDSSVAPAYVDKYRVDPTKAERFALEEMFVQDQMDELFPDGGTTAFREQLRGRWQQLDRRTRTMGDADAQLGRLFADTQAIMQNMSAPVVERYTIAWPSETPTDAWKREELAAWRYRQIHGKAIVYDNLAKFVDPTILGKSSNFTDDVYDISLTGGALPGIATEALYNVIQLASEYQSATGDKVGSGELRDLAQANRRQLMKLAAINIDHFTASVMSESIGGALDPGTRRPAALDEAAIVRNSNGKLDLSGSLFKAEVASSQAGARLGCVALRVNVEGGPGAAEIGAQNNKINSIELLSKLIFDEAYNRGIFRVGLAQAA